MASNAWIQLHGFNCMDSIAWLILTNIVSVLYIVRCATYFDVMKAIELELLFDRNDWNSL